MVLSKPAKGLGVFGRMTGTKTPTKSTGSIGGNVTQETLGLLVPRKYRNTTSFVEDFLASLSRFQGRGVGLKTPEGLSFLRSYGFLGTNDHDIFCSKMFGVYLVTKREKLSRRYLGFSPNWGTEQSGVYLTASISGFLNHERGFIYLGLFGTDRLMLGKGKSKPRRFSLVSQRGLEIQTSTGKKLAECPPRLYEWMQGFPLGWTEGLPKTVRKSLLGNAVTTNVITAIGRNLV